MASTPTFVIMRRVYCTLCTKAIGEVREERDVPALIDLHVARRHESDTH